MDTVRISGIVRQSIVDGPGLRFTVFTQGCPHQCEGCHNPETWDEEGGYLIAVDTLLEEFKKDPLSSGVTLSGGEPLCQPEPLLAFVRAVKAMGKDVICFTGYTLEELFALQEEQPPLKEILSLIDILIDGPFVLAERDLILRFRGSRNQRILDLPKSLAAKKPILIEKYM